LPPAPQANAEGPASSRVLQPIDAFCERAILVVVVLVMLWGPLAFGGLPEAGFLGIQALTMLALGLWAVRIWVQRPFRLLWPPICWAVLAFLLYAIVRCQDRFVQIEYNARTELIQVLVYAALFFVVVNNLQRRESATVIALCLIGLGMVLSWDAAYQYATNSASVWGLPRRAQFIGRGSATYINPDHLAGFLGLGLPLALSYTVLSRFQPVLKVLFGYCALAMMAGIGVTLSRGGIVATGATLVVFCLVLLLQRGYWLPGLAVLVGIVAVVSAFAFESESVQKRFEGLFNKGKLINIRQEYWPAALHIFEDHPLWGGGPGHFDSEFAKYRPRNVQNRPVYAHNDYLNTLSDWGAVGLAIIVAALGLLYYGVAKSWPTGPPTEVDATLLLKSDRAAFLMGASLGLLDILFHSGIDFNMHVPANAAIVVTLMALLSGHWRFVRERFWVNPRWFGRIIMTAVLAASVGWLAIQGEHRGWEAYWLHRAADETAPVSDRLAGLENAYKAEPSNYANSYNLGEYYRLSSQEGKAGYEALAREAMQWYEKSMRSNPLDAYVPMRYGMCLDSIGQTNQATPYFIQAENMDPNDTHVAYFVGRHYVELGDNATALRWFGHSIDIQWNDLAFSAWHLLQERMADPSGLYK
jgi:O-antigen ligase